jgi:hypothetical protein
MANRDCKDLQSLSREVKVISGVITVLGAASAANNVVSLVSSIPGATGINGVASVARTGTGLITLTLSDKWVGLEGLSCVLSPHGGAARGVNISSADVVSAKTVIFKTVNASLVATDTPNTNTDTIYFTLFLKNSTVK